MIFPTPNTRLAIEFAASSESFSFVKEYLNETYLVDGSDNSPR
jgi:hypothetical protein